MTRPGDLIKQAPGRVFLTFFREKRVGEQLVHGTLVGGGGIRLTDTLEGLLRLVEQTGEIVPQLLHVEYRVPLALEDVQIGVIELVVKGPQLLSGEGGAALAAADQGGVGQQPLAQHPVPHQREAPLHGGAVLRGAQTAVIAHGAGIDLQRPGEVVRPHRLPVKILAHPGVQDEQRDGVAGKALHQGEDLLRVPQPQAGLHGNFAPGGGEDAIQKTVQAL